MKKCQRFLSEIFQLLKVKFSTYLHGRVFIMDIAVHQYVLKNIRFYRVTFEITLQYINRLTGWS